MRILKYAAVAAILSLAGCAVVPKPLTDAEFQRRASADLGRMFEKQEPVTRSITLSEAMARAIKYNLDHRLKLMETALERANLTAVQFDELPKLTASAGYHQRSNDSGGVSQSIQTRTQSLVASTSQERVRVTGEVAVAWNLLDFGISYAHAQQQANRVMVSMEQRRKVMQNIIQDVRYAWWRAVSAEIMLNELKKLMRRTTTALARSERMEKGAIQSPEKALQYQRDLLEDIRQMWQLVQRLSMAKTELAALINLKPGTTFHVAIPKDAFTHVAMLHPDMRALERLALVNRPELRQEDYRKRVDALEVRKAILRMLPGIEINAGYQHDSNTFLFNNSWGSASEAITWNIFQIFSGPAAIRAARTQLDVGDSRRLALSMAVVTQVHLAYQRYRLALKDYELEHNLADVQGRLNTQAAARQRAGTGDELAQIHSATSLLVAKLRQAQAYAELQNAMGRLFNSLGLDAAPTFAKEGVAALAKRLQGQTDAWVDELNRLGRSYQGGLPPVSTGMSKQAVKPAAAKAVKQVVAAKPEPNTAAPREGTEPRHQALRPVAKKPRAGAAASGTSTVKKQSAATHGESGQKPQTKAKGRALQAANKTASKAAKAPVSSDVNARARAGTKQKTAAGKKGKKAPATQTSEHMPITPGTKISEASSPAVKKSVATGIVLRGVYPGRVPASRAVQLLVLSGSRMNDVDAVFVNWGRGDKRLHVSRVQHLDAGHIALRIKTGRTPGIWTVFVKDAKRVKSNTVRFEVVGAGK